MKNNEDVLKKLAEEDRKKQARVQKKKDRIVFCHKMSLVYNPIAALTFVGIYWAVGLKNAQFY